METSRSNAEIAAALRQQGKSVAEIAEAMGVHERTVRKWFQARPVLARPVAPADVPSSMAEIIGAIEAALAIEVAAIKARLADGQTGATSAIWRALKSAALLQQLGGDTPMVPEDERARFREELLSKLTRLAAARAEGEAGPPPAE